jgi:4-amino-4-deoxychorismate lyase
MTSIIINGELTDHINPGDRGLQYGDGLFETIAIKDGQLLLWSAHMKRLNEGCKALNLPVIDEEIWLADIRSLNLKDSRGVIKLILTRGQGGRGYQYINSPEVTRIVSNHNWPEYPDSYTSKGVKSFFCNTRVSINSTLSGIKHLNRLDNVLARNEWQSADIAEGIMLNDNDHVIEGTMSNIFAVNDDIVYTPLLNNSGVKGVMRDAVINLSNSLNIEVQELDLSRELLLNMDEIFLTNSLIGIWPVMELDNYKYTPGKTTGLLMDKLDMTRNAQSI